MAQYILGNDIVVLGSVLRRGRKVDDDFDNVPQLLQAGAVLLPVSVALENRVTEVQQQAAKGLNQTEQDSLTTAQSEIGGGGNVTAVTGTPPITSSGGATPAIGITAATGVAPGSMSAADKTKLDGIAAGATNTPLTASAPADVGTSPVVGIATDAARADHVHDLPFTPVQAALGAATGAVSVNSQLIQDVAYPVDPDDAATKQYVDDNIMAAAVPATRTLTAGAGLTGGGNLTADRTFDVVANADGSIIVNADDVQVGTLATDGQHGTRGGGTQHAAATGAVAGFMSAADKTKLNGIDTGATNTPLAVAAPTTILPDDVADVGVGTTAARADHTHGIAAGTPGSVAIGDSASEGASTSFARADHTHAVASPAAPANVTKAAASAGASADMARADHKHDITTATAVAVGLANAEGTSSSLSRADHVHAAKGAVLAFGSSGVASTVATRYLHPFYEATSAPTTAISYKVPFAGTLRNLFVLHNVTAGNGNAIVYTVRVNGSATALTVSLASTSGSGSDVANTVAVAQGDTVDIEVTKAAGIGTTPTDVIATMELAPA